MTLLNTPTAWDERAAEPESWRAAMWSKAGQEARFEAVLRRLQLRDGQTLLDYGCGTGRFQEWLPDGIHYYGHDWSRVMRERARTSGATILRRLDELTFDHVVVIGTFNLAHSWSKERTWAELEKLWKRARRSMVVCLYRGIDFHLTFGGKATCFDIDDDQAAIGGWITHSTDPGLRGLAYLVFFEDNGSPALGQAGPDVVSQAYILPADAGSVEVPEGFPAVCPDAASTAHDAFDVQGNFVVTDR